MAWLRATMLINENFTADSLARRHRTDVNGRPLGGRLVTVYGRLPTRPEQFVILLHLRPDDTVERAEVNLLLNLMPVRTEDVYDQSGFFDMVSRLTGRRCPGIAKLALYRFFENVVKPRIVQQRKDYSSGLNSLHQILSHAAPVPFCGGASLAYTNLLEWRGTKDPAAAAKRSEFSSIELQ